tara:strand:+ start:331 stop:501 length:171 start_codon:yes stop_codon:yes gene_type:complete
MEEIQNKLETLIDDIEGNSQLTREEILISLSNLKTEIEDYNLQLEEGGSLQWEDLD